MKWENNSELQLAKNNNVTVHSMNTLTSSPIVTRFNPGPGPSCAEVGTFLTTPSLNHAHSTFSPQRRHIHNQLSLNVSSALSDKISSGASAKTPLTPNKKKKSNNLLNTSMVLSFNEEGADDSQQGTLESTDGHYTAASAFASKGKFLI